MKIRNGDEGIQVKYLQQGLKMMCCNPGTIDSKFGTKTYRAVKKYQEEFGLSPVSGIVDDDTWNSLMCEIKSFQRNLRFKGYYDYSIDGVVGDYTYNALLDFQEAKGLMEEGMVGPATWGKLMNYGIGGAAADNDLPFMQGDIGDKVVYLQYALRILCYSPGVIDGSFGMNTYNAVVKFQNDYSINSNGIVRTETWNKMRFLIKDIQFALTKKGYEVGGMDSIAGPGTYRQVVALQKANSLFADGQVGPATREILFGSVGEEFLLKKGSSGTKVLYLQYGLIIMCINSNGADGTFSEGTIIAVKKFQQKYNLTVDGIVGIITWEALRSKIRPIQQALSNRSYDVGSIDGIADEKTYNSVIQYQRDSGFLVDGMVGTVISRKLLSGNTRFGTVSSTLKQGSDGSLTKYLQRVLVVLGSSINIDGIFGSTTKDAVIAFQKKNKLVEDGIVGNDTWNKLFEIYEVPVFGTGIAKMVGIAKHELLWGFKEDNSNNITPYGLCYGLNESEWSAMFVSYCAKQAGILGDIVPKFAYCPFGIAWYKSRGRYYKRNGGYEPKIGDIVFFYSSDKGSVSFTGIVVEVSDNYLKIIQGNLCDGVATRLYEKKNTYIDGYGDNMGRISAIPNIVSKEDMNKALMNQYVKLLNVANIEIPEVFNIVLGKEFEVAISSDLKVSFEAKSETIMFSNLIGDAYFTIKNGEMFCDSIKLMEDIAVDFSEGETEEECINILRELFIAIENGNGAISFSADGDWVSVQYVIEKDVDVNDISKQAFSFIFTIAVKKDSMKHMELFNAIEDTIAIYESSEKNNDQIIVVLLSLNIFAIYSNGVEEVSVKLLA
jgi:peptidoglycan hydrolase-like protein with peptidoglycan-binding domain